VKKIPRKKSKVERGLSDESLTINPIGNARKALSSLTGAAKAAADAIKEAAGSLHLPSPLIAPADPSKGDQVIGVALEPVQAGEFVKIMVSSSGKAVTQDSVPVVKTNDPVDKQNFMVTVPNSLMEEILQEICNETEWGVVKKFGYDQKKHEWNLIIESVSGKKLPFPTRIKLRTKEDFGPTDAFRRTRQIKKKVNEKLKR